MRDMNILIRKMGLFVRIITFNWPIAITLAPFGIYIKEKYWCSKTLRRHEMIHWKQQMEMLIIPFYLWYFIEWVIKLFKYGKDAYHNISFEREANRSYEYPDDRKPFAWIKYI